MEGALSYKRPNLLRIDFTNPAGQVIVSDGSVLTVYYPRLEVIFEQKLCGIVATTNVAGLASRQGLDFLQSNYAIAYLEGPDPVAAGRGLGASWWSSSTSPVGPPPRASASSRSPSPPAT